MTRLPPVPEHLLDHRPAPPFDAPARIMLATCIVGGLAIDGLLLVALCWVVLR